MSPNGSSTVTIHSAKTTPAITDRSVQLPEYDRERLEDIGFLTSMTLVLLGNYHQTGHFGGLTVSVPYRMPSPLAGPHNCCLTVSYRRPKHPPPATLLHTFRPIRPGNY